MAKAFEFGVCYLLSEFFAHTDGIFVFNYPARTVSVFSFQPFPYRGYDLFVGIENYFHKTPLFNYTLKTRLLQIFKMSDYFLKTIDYISRKCYNL